MPAEPDRSAMLRSEIEALGMVKDTAGMQVILREFDRRIKAVKEVPLGENNWALKQAHAQGYAHALRDFRMFILSRLTGGVSEDGKPSLGRL